MNVLIASVSREVSLVRAFQRALAQEGGGKVIAVDMDPLVPALYVADEHELVPPTDDPGFLPLMLRLCKQRNVQLLLSARDEDLPFLAQKKGAFAEVGTTVMVADPEVIETCQDKKKFLGFCKENGFEHPITHEGSPLPPDVPFPLFIKPRHGKGGQGAHRVLTREGLGLALLECPEAIVQEFIQAPEYTLDLFADFTGKVISVIPRQRIKTVGGESFVGQTSKNPLLIQEGIRLATALGLIGHNTIQCFLDQGCVKLTEVNPRYGGGAHLGFAAGAPTPLFLIQLLKGETVNPRIGEFMDGYLMLRYAEDLFFDRRSFPHKVFSLE